MITARRTFTYAMNLAGLLVTLFAASGMLALMVTSWALGGSGLLETGDLRARASLYLAELVVGLPIWIGFALFAERAAGRSEAERQAWERRLFMAAVFGVTAVVALVALHGLLQALFTLPGITTMQPVLQGAISAGARLFVFGAAWLAHARLQRARGPATRVEVEHDAAHDIAVYVLAGVALAFLATGALQALSQILNDLLHAERPVLLVDPALNVWRIWGAIAAWLVSGGAVWALVSRYDLARGGRRTWRVLYLYLVLLVAVPAALASAGDGLYELLRRLFGFQPLAGVGYWDFLRDVVPPLLVGGAAWLYHWPVVRAQAQLGDGAGAPSGPSGGIPWPRRPGLALLMLLGLAAAAPAFVSLLWLGLDFLLNTGQTLSGGDWWRDRLSLGIAAGAVGGASWLGAWLILQRAAEAAPEIERRADARRRVVIAIVLVGALTALGFLIALLWLLFRALLGDALGPDSLSLALKELSAALVAAALAAYYGWVLRQDMRHETPSTRRLRVVALLAPGAEPALTELRKRSGLAIELGGYLSDGAIGERVDLETLTERLSASDGDRDDEQAWLILAADGGALFRYRRDARP